MVYLCLDKEFVNNNLKKWNEQAISTIGEDGKDDYLFTDDEPVRISDITEDSISLICETSKIGYICLELKLDSDDLLSLIELAVKKLNKFKTVLEGLK